MLTYDNIKIISTRIDDDYYDEKKRKHIKYKHPKITKKTLFDGNVFDLGELYTAMKFATDQDNYNEISVNFNIKQEY
tara:strand:+ start:320 stop:550 length:231 start_codon:yes stop_codon:yes gene_type:complete